MARSSKYRRGVKRGTKPKPTPTILGTRVREERTARGWSQAELARRAGLATYQHVSMIERGERGDPRGKTLEKIADAFGLPVQSLQATPSIPPALQVFLESDAGRDATEEEIQALQRAPLFLGSTPSSLGYGQLLVLLRSEKARK